MTAILVVDVGTSGVRPAWSARTAPSTTSTTSRCCRRRRHRGSSSSTPAPWRRPCSRWPGRPWPPAVPSRAWGSPTNEARPSCGTARTGEPVGPGIGWQDLRTVGTCLVLRDQGIRVAPNESATKLACSSTWPIPTAPATCASAPWTPGWRGRCRVARSTSPTPPTPASPACWPATGRTGTTPCSTRCASPGACCPPSSTRRARWARRPHCPAPRSSAASPATSRRRSSARAAHDRAWPRPPSGRAACSTCAWARPPRLRPRGGAGTFPIVAWQRAGHKTWGVEAVMLSAGTCVEWLRDDLGIIDTAADSHRVAAACDDTGDVWFVPALLGLGAPVWDFGARGTFVGHHPRHGAARDGARRARGRGPPRRRPVRVGRGRHRHDHRDPARRRRHVGQPHLRRAHWPTRWDGPSRSRPSPRPPPSAPPTWPAWPSGCGPTRTTWPRRGGPRPWSSPAAPTSGAPPPGPAGWRHGNGPGPPCPS